MTNSASASPFSAASPSSGLAYEAIGLNLKPLAGGGSARGVMDFKYAGTTGGGLPDRPDDEQALTTERLGVITTFVPEAEGYYKKRMLNGENAFRKGRYLTAAGSFRAAGVISLHSPESHLARAHAAFALGEYNSGAYHVQRAIDYFPELPLVRMELRGFYGEDRKEDFDRHFKALQEAVEERGSPPELLLLLAYVQYFDGKTEEAVASLRSAHEVANEPRLSGIREAAGTFWDALAAVGEVEGSLGGDEEQEPPATGGEPSPTASAPAPEEEDPADVPPAPDVVIPSRR